MAHYLDISGQIYGIYLKYAAPEHIHVYSIDEVFIDATPYLRSLGMGPHAMARTIVREILTKTGITATAGIGSNMYLAKVAMDIVAKHMPADKDGVRVAELNEMSYRRLLWDHRPLTDFWRVGRGYAKKLEHAGLMTMGDIARCSVGRASDYYYEDLLSMPNCSSTMRGAGSRAKSRISDPMSQVRTALAVGRCSPAPPTMPRPG